MLVGKDSKIQFKKLEEDTILEEAEILLNEIVFDWITMSKRYSLSSSNLLSIKRCQFYVEEIIKKFPILESKLLHDYYDQAICEFAGMEYKIRRDKEAQIAKGFEPLIVEGKSFYLFTFN